MTSLLSRSTLAGEIIWIEAARGDLRGYGEGCPRPYVTGETIASCRQWADRLADIRESCASLAALNAWAERNAASLLTPCRVANVRVARLLGLRRLRA